MTGTSEKARAVFFALIMVTSVMAAGVAFTGNVAAATPPEVSAGSTDFVNGSATQTLGGSGTNALNISEGAADVGSFGSSGSASITVPDGVTFNQSDSNLGVRQVNNGSISNVQFTDDSTIEFDYTTSSGQTDILFADVVIDVAPSFNSGDLTATVGVESNTLKLNGRAATLSTTTSDVARGNTQTGSQDLTIDGDTVDGQHAQGENITISTPSDAQFSFDTSQDITVNDGDDGGTGDAISGTSAQSVVVTSDTLEFNLTGDDLASGDQLVVSSVQYNVSGDNDPTTDSEFTDRLELTTVPVDSTGTVTTTSDTDNLNVEASTAALMSDVTLGAGTTQQGNVDVRVYGNDTGEIIGQDTNVTVSIPTGTGVTFNTATPPTTGTNIGSGSTDSATFVDDRTVTAKVIDSSSSASEYVTFGGVQFNTTTDASVSNLNLTVETTAAGANAESVLVNTSTGTNNFISVATPALKTHNDNDLTIYNDKNGEVQVDPSTASASDEVSSNEANDIVVTSQANGDIVDSSEGTNVTVRIPDGSAITFDQSSSAGTTGGTAIDGGYSATIVDDRTLNITAQPEGGSNVDGTEEFVIQDVQYNVTGGTSDAVQLTSEVNRTSVTSTSANYINVSQLTEDKIQGDAEGPGVDSWNTDSDEESSIEVGTTQTAGVRALNASNSDFPYGGATVDLEVTGTPDGASASLNTTSVTTAEDGTAAFNVTLGDTAGYYNVTASLAQNSSKNVTLRWNTDAGSASQVNVTQAKDALATGSSKIGNPAGTGEALYRVRVEDSGGNIVNTGIDMGLIISGDAQVAGGYGDFASDASTTDSDADVTDSSSILQYSDSDERVDYVPGNDGTTKGEFYIVLTDSTEEEVSLEVNPEADGISSDSATAQFYKTQNVNVQLNRSTTTTSTYNSAPVEATAELTNGNNEVVTVPNVTATWGLSNSSVASLSGSTSGTNFDGQATQTLTADQVGTTDVEALSRNRQGVATLTVEDPDYGITDVTLDPSTATSNTSVEHNLQYTVTAASNDGNSDTYTITLPNSTEITSENINNVTDANGNEISISSSASLADANGGTNNQLEFGIQPDSSYDTSAVTVDANITVDWQEVNETTTSDVTLDVSDSSNGNTNATTSVTIEPETLGTLDVSVDPQTVTANESTDVTVTVTDNASGDAVEGATVDISDLQQSATTDANGTATFSVNASSAGPYPIDVSAAGYEDASATLTVQSESAGPSVIGDSPAQDLDGDGTFEDVNGDGEFNIIDVGALLDNRDGDAVQNNIDMFDFNNDGSVNIIDVGALLQQSQA